jgi:hypothetical protein
MADDLEEYWAEIRPKVVETKAPSLAQALQEEVTRRCHLIEVMTGVPPRDDAVDALRYAIGAPNDVAMRDYVDRDPEQQGTPIRVGIGLTGGMDLDSIHISASSSNYQVEDTLLLRRELQELRVNQITYSSTINTLIEVVRSLQTRVQELEFQAFGSSNSPYFNLQRVP